MRENRMMPMGLNTFHLTVNAEPGGLLHGQVHSIAMDRRAEFTSLSRMIILLEEWLDTVANPPLVRPCDAVLPADFKLEVLFRQNYSWQGRLRSLKDGTETTFRSVLELLIQLETLLAQ